MDDLMDRFWKRQEAPRYYWRTILDEDDEGDMVIYGLKWPSFSFWIVPGTAKEVVDVDHVE